MQELIRTGLIRPDEAERVGEESSHEMYGSNWWMPLKWCAEILSKAMQDGVVLLVIMVFLDKLQPSAHP